MKKFISRAFPVFMAVVLLIAACPLGAVAETPVSFTEEFTSAEDFATKWETTKTETGATYTEVAAAKVTTAEDVVSGMLLPSKIQKSPDQEIVTTVKDEYWPGSKTNRLTNVTARLYLPSDTAQWKSANILLGYIDKDNYLKCDFAYNAQTGELGIRFNSKANGIANAFSTHFNAAGKYFNLGTEANGDYDGNFTISLTYDYSKLDAGQRYNVYPFITVTTAKGEERTYTPNTNSGYQGILPGTVTDGGATLQNFDGSQKVGTTFNYNNAVIYVDNLTCTFENSAEAYIGTTQPEEPPVEPEDDYAPVINGATIKRTGSQDLRFNCEFGDIREDKEVAEYGLILTFKQYIDNGDVSETDMVADSTNEYVRVIKSSDVENVAKGNEFYANVGNIYPEAYGYRYSARVYVKYNDGTTVDYSDILDRSVISVAKAMSKFAFDKQLAGISDIVSAVDGDNVTWTYDPNTDNGVTILEWIQTNQQAIVDAYNAENQ